MAELMGPVSDFEQQQLDLMQRKGRYAQQQAMNMPSSGQMVGNRFVATNPLNYLAEMLRGYGAKRGEEQATEQLKDLQGKRQDAMIGALRKSNEYMTGAPAVASKTTATEMPTFDDADAASMQGIQGYGATTGGQAAVAPDPFKASIALIESGIPSLQTAGFNQQMELNKTNAAEARAQANKARNMDLWQQSGGDAQKFVALGGDLDMAETMAKLPGLGKKKPIAVGNTLVDPDTFKPVYTAEPKVNMATDYLIPDGKGGYMPNTQLIQVKQGIQASGRAPAAPKPVDQGKPLPTKEIDKITGFDESLGTQTRLMETFQDNFGGYKSDVVGGLANTVGSKFDKGLQAQSEWWAAHEANDNVMRNKLFGASLTAGEQAAWDRTSIKPGMSASMIKNRMKERADLINAQRNTTIGNLGKGGYNVSNFGTAPDTFKPTQQQAQTPAKPSAQARTVVRTGTMGGRKVVQYSDGTTDYAD